MSHQLAESRNKFVRVITKQPLFEIFPEMSRTDENLALVQDKSQKSPGRNIGKITIKHASHQLTQYRDKVFLLWLILCVFQFPLFYFICYYFGDVPEWGELRQENNGDKNL